MSLFRWVEDKLEQLDPISAPRDTPPSSDLEKAAKETQSLQEQVVQLRSDLRTSRNYAEQQLAVSGTQAKDAACAEEVARLGQLLEQAEMRVSAVMRENEALRKELEDLKITSEWALGRAERLQAIFESSESALSEGDSAEAACQLRVLFELQINKNTEIASDRENLRSQLTETLSKLEALEKSHSQEMIQYSAIVNQLKAQLSSRSSDESLTEARNIEALTDHLQAKQRIIDSLLSEKTMLALKLDRQAKENLELQQVTQEKEKADSISGLRLIRSRKWLRRSCEAVDGCLRWGLDHVRENPVSRLAVLTYWLTVQGYILLVVMNAGEAGGPFLQ